MSLQKRKQAFLNIVNQIKGFVRGVIGRPPLTLPNCVDNKSLINYKIYGDSVQDNRNLLRYDIKTTTSGGVTWTVNEDRSITVSDTPSTYSGFTLINQVFDPDWVGKTLTFYYTGVDIANASPVLNMYRADGTNFTGYPFNHTLASNTIHTITVPDEAVNIKITIQRGSNNVECTGTFYPMLLMGKYTADNIPTFDESNVFPTPDNPIEVQSVGEKTGNILDVATAPFIHNARTSSTITALFERTSTGLKGSFYRDLTGVATRIGYTLGRTEDFKGKTITASYDEAILNSGAKPIIAIYTVNKPGVDIDYMDENTTFNEVVNGYVSTSGIGIEVNNSNSQDLSFFSYTIPEDADSESFPYVCVLFYIGYNAESNPAGSTFEYKGIKVEVASNENVFDVSKATILKRLSDSTAEFDGNELVVNKTNDAFQERTVVTIPTTKKNTRMSVTVTGGDGTSQYGIYMTNEIPTTHTVITTHSVNTEDYAYINIVIIISTSYIGTVRYNITLNECGSVGYEPYGYKIPVIARGKNLIPYPYADTTKEHSGITFTDNGDGSITANGKVSDTRNAIFYFYRSTEGLQDGKYALSGATAPFELYCRGYSTADMIGMYADAGNGSVGNVSGQFEKGVTIYASIPKGTIVENLVIRPQLELSPEVTPYELYVEPVTTNIYAKEPIRRIYDYADIINLSTQKITRNIKETILNGTENCSIGGAGTQSERILYNLSIFNAMASTPSLCTHAKSTVDSGLGWSGSEFILFVGTSDVRFYRPFYCNIADFSEPSPAIWRNYLSQLYAEGNPYKVYCVREEPEEEDISLPTLPTVKGTTIYEVDTTVQPSKMEVEYYSTSKE